MCFLWPRFNGTDKILLLFTIATCIFIPSQNATHGKNLLMESTQWMFLTENFVVFQHSFLHYFSFSEPVSFKKNLYSSVNINL